MAAASCVQEEKDEKEIQEPSDTIAQGNYVIKLPTLFHIACEDATGKYFATHRRTEGNASTVHHSLVGIWVVCLEASVRVVLS